MRTPDAIFAAYDAGLGELDSSTEVSVSADGAIRIACPTREISRVALRWREPVPEQTLILGDAWERGYGDLQWRHLQPERLLPWYVVCYDDTRQIAWGVGVLVRPAAMCSWTIDADGYTLWLDLRSGGSPVRLGDRVLDAATVIRIDGQLGESPYRLQRRLCQTMCSDARIPEHPIVGANNWYYAYGKDFGPDNVVRDAETIVELSDGHPVRPFSVIDAGWTPHGGAPGGPWNVGTPGLFDDMAAVATRIAKAGARPGIWIRPAALSVVDDERRLRAGPRPAREQPLDLTLDENLETIRADIARLRQWGYELIKHDFSTFDHFGRFGPAMGAQLTDPGWRPADPSRTNAEILLRLYRTIREAAGDAVIIGCNTVSHLAAGLVEVQRIGDDTSGREWERTRHMGVNTLAFRLAQHGAFYVADADCVPSTPQTPWEKNRQFLELVARSGTALFVSVDPSTRNPTVDADLRAALRIALDAPVLDSVEPLDWLTTTCPRRWRGCPGVNGTGEYDWTLPYGVPPR